MSSLLTKQFNLKLGIFGFFLLLLGFFNLSFGWILVLSPYSLALTGLIAFYMVFGKDFLLLFTKPIKPLRYFILYFLLIVLVTFGTSYLLQYILNFGLASNPIGGHVPWVKLPFMLFGEELISFYTFILTANLLKKNKHNLLIGNLVSAALFAILHITTYWNGNFFLTLFHVLALQGIARIIFNTSGIKSNTILVPFMIHFIFDVITLLAAS